MTYEMRKKIELAVNNGTSDKEIASLLKIAYAKEDKIGKEVIEKNISSRDLLMYNII